MDIKLRVFDIYKTITARDVFAANRDAKYWSTGCFQTIRDLISAGF